ncbi:TPA: histidine--tRNA ligase, partial [bacterium]|nr:histidine--tRNA ligase [bacterium]
IEQMGGKPTPALGFGCGQNRLIATMEAQNVTFPEPPKPMIYIACLSDKAYSKAFEIAHLLRQKDIATEVDFDGRSLKSQMKTANKMGAKFVAIMGDDELDKGIITLRDMLSGEQESINLSMVVDVLSKK